MATATKRVNRMREFSSVENLPQTNGRSKVARVQIPRIRRGILHCHVIGESPLIMHRFAEKARKQIEGKQQGKAKGPREKREPKEEFLAAQYRLSNGKPCFPASGFKQAMVSACRFVEGISMTLAQGAFTIVGDPLDESMVRIKSDPPKMRTDIGRIGKFGSKTTTVIYRPEFNNWSADLTIDYLADVLTPEQLINLLNRAGFCIGIGDWRPEKKGNFGRFRVGES